MTKFSLYRLFETSQYQVKYIWDKSPISYCVKNLTRKFVVWLVIFVALCVFPYHPLRIIAYGLLAMKLSQIVITVSWHFMGKEFVSRLDEKAVFITGCDSGFGNILARKLDRRGVTVYAGCLLPEGDGASELKNSCSSRLKILHLDVTSDYLVQKAVKTVTSTLGNKKLWAVVNNAGIGIGGEVEWTPVEVCQKTMEVNAIGPYRVSQAFLPLLRKSQGRIVIVASVLGHSTAPGSSSYCMSKYAAVSLADALRRELIKWNVSVHTIEPWLYSTNITNKERVRIDLEKNWNAASEETRKEYGENYIKEYEKSINMGLSVKRPASKVYEVPDALEHAAIGKDPKIRYVPGLIGHIWTWLSCSPAEEIQDLLAYFLTPHIKQ